MSEAVGAIGSDVVLGALAWLLTYAVHSTLLLGIAVLLSAIVVRSDAWRDTLWKTALIGGLLTASVQALAGFRPAVGQWTLPVSAVSVSQNVPVESLIPAPTQSGEMAAPAGTEPARLETVMAPSAWNDSQRDESATVSPALAEKDGRPAEARDTPTGWEVRWIELLLGAWIAGALFLLGRIVLHQWKLYRLLRDRRKVEDGRVLAMLAELRRNAGVWRPIRLTVTAACPTPLALGLAEICVPDRFLSDLDRDQQRTALAHELAHLDRHDPFWHLAAYLVEAVFFFQPLNRLARLRLRASAENLCDDWAVHQTGSAVGLARCLAEVASWVGRGTEPVPPGTMAMAEGGSPLLRRVERLLSPRGSGSPRGLRFRSSATLGLLVLVAVVAPFITAEPGEPPHKWSGDTAAAEPNETNREVQARQEVIRHPDPSQPLVSRWEWAFDEADRRGDRGYWIAYGFGSVLRPDQIIVEDSHGWSTSEFDGTPLGNLVFGPSYRAPRGDGDAAVRQPLLVLFHVADTDDDPQVVRVAARSPSVGMPLDGEPLFWLGLASEPESFEWLRSRVGDLPEPILQGTVVELIAMHPTSDRVVPFLSDIIRSGRAQKLRVEAAEGLEWHSTPESVAVLLETALRDRSVEVASEAAEALGEIRSTNASAALADIVRSDAPVVVRGEAVESMSGHPNPAMLETLVQVAMEDPDPGIQDEAIETISEFPGVEIAPILERIARTHPDPQMREEAVEKIDDADPNAAVRIYEELLREESSPDLRREALEALAEHPSPRAFEAVYAAARSDPDPDVQKEAVETLAELDPAAAAPRLGRIAFEHPEPPVRRQAAESLGELPAEFVLPILDDILERHPDERVVQQAVESIAELPSEVSQPRLVEIARSHPAERVRREAQDQLGDRAP